MPPDALKIHRGKTLFLSAAAAALVVAGVRMALAGLADRPAR
jgi:hypothetical protein